MACALAQRKLSSHHARIVYLSAEDARNSLRRSIQNLSTDHTTRLAVSRGRFLVALLFQQPAMMYAGKAMAYTYMNHSHALTKLSFALYVQSRRLSKRPA